eukprot:GGOE01004260.1.p1 GENE.GGOE01004260.1~~GGOE01004260.1.p1  ORF type:complete len:244 (+),score=97.95 GGOE01004260.1:40-732(+)
MAALAKITAYFKDSAELWTAIQQLDNSQYPLGNIVLKPVAEEDSEPCDFSGDLRVVQLSDSNIPDLFPAIWVGKDEWEEKLDEYPIYLLDLQEAAEPFEPLGNFKKYLTLVLEFFLNTNPEEAFATAAKAKLEALSGFSDVMVEKGLYTVSIPEDAEDGEEGEDGGVPGAFTACREDGEGEDGDDTDGAKDAASPPTYEGEGQEEDGEAGGEADGGLKRKREEEEGTADE